MFLDHIFFCRFVSRPTYKHVSHLQVDPQQRPSSIHPPRGGSVPNPPTGGTHLATSQIRGGGGQMRGRFIPTHLQVGPQQRPSSIHPPTGGSLPNPPTGGSPKHDPPHPPTGGSPAKTPKYTPTYRWLPTEPTYRLVPKTTPPEVGPQNTTHDPPHPPRTHLQVGPT